MERRSGARRAARRIPGPVRCIARDTRRDLRKHPFGDTGIQPGYTLTCALTCGNAARDTKTARTARSRPGDRALGASTMGQGLEPDHGQLVALRPLREAARHASPVRGRQEGPRPDLAARHGQVPEVRPAGTEPAHAHLHRPHRLQEAEGRGETPAAGRGTQAETEACRRPETGPREGTPAGRGGEAQAGRSRRRCEAQGTTATAVTRRHEARLRDLFGPALPELPLPDLPGRTGGGQGPGPCRGPRHGLRRGLRQRFPRRVRRRGRIRRQVRRFQ